MEGSLASPSNRYYCSFEGCARSFIRKEHLTRHTLSHTGAPSYICKICSRAFTRNDVLQKHIRGHTARQESTERNKRACQPCHRAKIRCAGGLPCQNCVKRRIPCTLDNHGGARGPQSGAQKASSSGSSGTGWEQAQRAQIRKDPYYTAGPQGDQYYYPAPQYQPSYQQKTTSGMASTSANFNPPLPRPLSSSTPATPIHPSERPPPGNPPSNNHHKHNPWPFQNHRHRQTQVDPQPCCSKYGNRECYEARNIAYN